MPPRGTFYKYKKKSKWTHAHTHAVTHTQTQTQTTGVRKSVDLPAPADTVMKRITLQHQVQHQRRRSSLGNPEHHVWAGAVDRQTDEKNEGEGEAGRGRTTRKLPVGRLLSDQVMSAEAVEGVQRVEGAVRDGEGEGGGGGWQRQQQQQQQQQWQRGGAAANVPVGTPWKDQGTRAHGAASSSASSSAQPHHTVGLRHEALPLPLNRVPRVNHSSNVTKGGVDTAGVNHNRVSGQILDGHSGNVTSVSEGAAVGRHASSLAGSLRHSTLVTPHAGSGGGDGQMNQSMHSGVADDDAQQDRNITATPGAAVLQQGHDDDADHHCGELHRGLSRFV